MRIPRRFIASAIVVSALAGGGVIATSATPAFAATCSGNGCNGQDPIAAGCSSDAYTVGSHEIVNGSTPDDYCMCVWHNR